MVQDFINRFANKLIEQIKMEQPAYDGEICLTRAKEWAEGYDHDTALVALDLAIERMADSGDYIIIQDRFYHMETCENWRRELVAEMMDALYDCYKENIYKERQQ